MKATYFTSGAAFRAWLEKNHAEHDELLVGFHKRATGAPSLTWNESVDAALCFGWIDGVRRGVDDARYTIRFTPRRKTSIWSVKNIKRMQELLAEGLVSAAGRAAFEARRADRTALYSFEQRTRPELAGAQLAALQANAKAWAWWQTQAPSYQRAASHWVISAKREETRASRLAVLIKDSAAGLRIAPMRPYPKPTPKPKPKPTPKPSPKPKPKRS
jgi:uncharacterized protein YdeI (YjbR/CyaY-like superfamily)